MNKGTEWFVDWFNSPYYHILYKNRDDKEAESFLKNLSRNLEFRSDEKILDLACGKGRHSIYLNRKGFNVTGLDLSEESIKEASTHSNEKLKFFVHDMREVFPAKFHFILNLFTSFGYFNHLDENLKVLNACKQMMDWNGRLVIDFFNADLVKKQLPHKELKQIGGIDFHISKVLKDGVIEKSIDFNDMGKDFHFTEKVQALGVADFRKLFAESGFELINTFGDYKLNPYQPESPRLILVAKCA